MKKILISASLALLALGCQSHRYEAQSVRYHDDGRAKAIVALTPVFDHQDIHLPWSLSDDLTEMIKTRLMKKSNVFIGNAQALITKIESDEETITRTLEHYDENKTHQIEYTSLKQKFPQSEFVVFLELAQHEIQQRVEDHSWKDIVTPSQELNMGMRIRIYDLRGSEVKVILQEIVEQKHHIPKQLAKLDYNSPIWGKNTYSISPVGIAHAQLAKEVATRIENYLILAKTQ